MATSPLRIGTRGSPLAMAQAGEVRDRLAAAHPGIDAEIVPVATAGDRRPRPPPPAAGGKGMFTGELEQALLAGRIDIAVHSMKDLPAPLSSGLEIDCCLPREDPRDMLVSPQAWTLEGLPRGAAVGTASPRRRALLLFRRPDLRIVPFHGNVDTRLARLGNGEVDAAVLAAAGINRLGRRDIAATALDPSTVLPAACQGIIGVQRRAGDRRIAALLEPVNDPAARASATAERALLAGLDGSCRTAIAALALPRGDRLTLRSAIARPDGGEVVEAERRGPWSAAAALGASAAAELRERSGPGFLHG